MRVSALLLFCVIAASPAAAQDKASRVMLGVTGGTLGIGPEVTFRASPVVGVRANATFLGFGHEVDSSDITYDGDLGLKSGGVMLDLHPLRNGFRISGGARIGDNRVDLLATPSRSVQIGNDVYTENQIGTVRGHVAADDFAPVATIGWSGGLTRGVKLGFEAGAMFHGTPRVNDLVVTGPFANNPAVLASLVEEEAEIESDIDGYKVYPVVQVSLGYAF
ncbi:hypothetical protein V5740_13015 [Croceibacterium sp. TMG7-5b_MA50]|uniref:hypothetical protein n=1 Tax=Croceibacterium sp. TMG7-5b_MA50 TaxID=3121290 RepID=UPI0032219299